MPRMRMTLFAKFFIASVVCAVTGYTLHHNTNLLSPVLPKKNTAMAAATAPVHDVPEFRIDCMAWMAQSGLNLANGGAQTAAGSLMEQKGVRVTIIHQDSTEVMQSDLLACAEELQSGKAACTKGAQYVVVMGDGSGPFLAATNEKLRKIGMSAKAISPLGVSRGEDAFMAPPVVRDNPRLAAGLTVAAVVPDGDWNIVQNYILNNSALGLCNNPDFKTYDPACVNWWPTDTFTQAAEIYNAAACEERPVVRAGVKTGETKKICVDAVTTWTPADVTVARGRGGVVRIVSTKDYSNQMHAVLIGLDSWNTAHSDQVVNLLSAVYEAGEVLATDPDAQHRAGELNHKIYGGENGAWWQKYYRGTTEKDAQGLMVELGGSHAYTLPEALHAFGMLPGTENSFGTAYTFFGNLAHRQYPNVVPAPLPLREVLDTTYLETLAVRTNARSLPLKNAFVSGVPAKRALAQTTWNIHFKTGSAELEADAILDLRAIKVSLIVANESYAAIHGHTDSVGNPATNLTLSEQRALAVKTWLEHEAPGDFPTGRLTAEGHGHLVPVAPNNTEGNRAKNRRVDIVVRARQQ